MNCDWNMELLMFNIKGSQDLLDVDQEREIN